MALELAFAFFGAIAGEPVATAPFMFPVAVLLALGVSKLQQKRQRAVSPKQNKERELLSAARNNGGSITSVRQLWKPRLP